MNVAISLSVALFCFACQGQDLREAVETSNVERVRELLKSGANANTTYENRFTPIYFAEDLRVVDLLLAHGAKLNIRDAALIQSPIERAAENAYRDEKRRETWKLIVTKLKDAGAEYTIDTAVYLNDIAFVRAALEKDDSWVNKSRGAQSVPLRVAARTGRVEICKLLLEHKADPNSFEEGSGYPILFDAIDYPAIVKLLIESGANLKRRITWFGGRTGVQIVGDEASALHYAVSAGNLETVKVLLDAGLDPNAADDDGQTPLHVAIRSERFEHSWEADTSGFLKIIKHLLNHDASIRLRTKSGQTPVELAKEQKSPKEIIQALEEKQNELDQAVDRARMDDQR